jgi:hypothetical protein
VPANAPCGRSEVRVNEHPRVQVRELPIGGRLARLVWREQRYRCSECGRTFTETHEQLPTRQRVTARFRALLAERVVAGAAHAEVAREEHTSRYQVAHVRGSAKRLDARNAAQIPRHLSLDEAHHRRGHEHATVVSDLDRAASSRCSTGATGARSSAGFRPCPPRLPGDRGRLDRPLRRLAPSHPRRAAARSDRLRPLPPRPRGQHRAGRGPPRPPTPSQGAQPPRARCGGQDAAWRPERYRRPPPAAQSARALDQARASPVERALRARADHRRGAGAKRDLR